MLNENLIKLRESNEYTKKYIGEYLNMTPEGYGHYETGKRKPSHEVIERLADLYGVSVDYILGRTDAPETQKSAPDGALEIPDILNDVQVAFHGGEYDDLTQDEIDKIAVYAKFVKSQRNEE